MGLELIAKETLAQWEKTYTDHLQGSEVTEETRSGLLSLENLKDFVEYIDGINQKNPPDEKIDGIEIYLTRWSECNDRTKVNKISSKGNIDQLSFAIVPLVGTENFFQINEKTGKEEIMCLYPGKQDKSDSGHCPPCIKQQKDGKKNSP